MICKFSAKNFYSFKETVTVNFQVNENAPDTDAYIKCTDGERVTKILSIIGPNASGKTNLLKILPFFHFLIVDSFTDLKPDEELPFDSYKFSSEENTPTELSVTFQCKETLFEYFIQFNKKQILEEKLRRFNKTTKQFSVLFTRRWRGSEDKYIYSLRNFNFSEKLTTKRKNATLLAIAAQSEHKLSKDIVIYWQDIFSNVAQLGRHNHRGTLFHAAEFYEKNPDIHTKADSLLSRFDLGLTKTKITKFNHKTQGGKEEVVYLPYGVHVINNREYPLEFFYESSGTQNLFILLYQILPVLESGGIAILDEFDADLHPLMLPELIDLFASKALNPKNAQLIFSTHHHEILNKVDKYQIILVEKDSKSNNVEVFRLDEIKGVRVDDNYYSKYIAGAYGAIPEI